MANGLFKSSAGTGAGALSSASAQNSTTIKTASLFTSQQKMVEEQRKLLNEYTQAQDAPKDNGGFFGGIGYAFEKLGLGFLQSIEGIWDYTAGGLADLFGAHDWAEQQIANDWVNYQHADEWYNPSDGWKVAGDVFGGIGTSVPALASIAVGAAITYFSGGTASPVAVQLITGATAGLIAGLGAAGTATKEAYNETGQLTGKEWGYGALSGFTEGAMEGVTDAIGFGAGTIVKSFTASAAKEGAKQVGKQVAGAVARQTLGKAMIKGFIGEAFEEGVQELIDPVWKRITYDPNAESATFQQVAYAALVGGLSGAIMSGVDVSVRNTVNYFRGGKINADGGTNGVIDLAQTIADTEGVNQSGNEQVDFVVNTLNELQESLQKTNGEVRTAKQKMLVGILSKANTAAPLSIVVNQNADAIVNDAETTVKRLNDIGYKTSKGEAVTVEMLTEGIDTSKRGTSEYRKSISAAMRNNEALRTVAVMSAAGQLNMDAARFQQSVLRGEQLFSQSDLNNFVENADDAKKRDVGERLGISDWATVTADELKSRIVDFSTNGGLDQYINEREQVKKLSELEISKKGLPKYVGSIKQDGAVRYKFGDASVAIVKNGDSYLVYDYANDVISKPLSKPEANRVIKEIYAASVASETNADVQTAAQQETQQLDNFARENIPDYKNLVGAQQQAVRRTLRQAKAAGVSEADQILYASVAARSGAEIEFVSAETLGANADAGYSMSDGKILVNREIANNPNARTAAKILLHEFTHAMIGKGYVVSGKKGKKHLENKVLNDFFLTAIKGLSTDQQIEILTPYVERHGVKMQDFLDGKVDFSLDTYVELREELAAHFVERELGNSAALQRIISDKPSFKDKLLSFLKRAKRDYSSNEKLSRAANALLKKYQNFFNKYATQTRFSPTVESDLSAYKRTDTAADNQTRLSIKQIDGKDVVVIDTDQHIFEGVTDAKELRRIARNYILQNFRNDVYKTTDGKGVVFTRKGAKKITNTEYLSKIRISTELNNFIKVAEYVKTVANAKSVNPEFSYFDYYRANFMLDGKMFNCLINVGVNTETGVGVFYEITQMKEAPHNSFDGNNPVAPASNGATTDIIPNNGENVNTNGKKSSKKRYALSVDGENITGEVEQTKNLVALHNLTDFNLLKVLKLGGFPMPSIAVTKPDIPFTDFGDITVIFGRETIDPANPNNEVYERDAWTPTVPRAEYKINETKVQEIIKRLTPYADEYGGADSAIRRFLNTEAMQELLKQNDGDLANHFAYYYETKYAFLRDTGVISERIAKSEIDPEITARSKEYKAWLDEMFADVAEKKGVRNRTGLFTPSGASRSFEETHYDYTLENIVKVMRSMPAQSDVDGYASTATLAAALAKHFSSIEDIKQAENLLSAKNFKEMSAARNEYEKAISEIVDSMAGRSITAQEGAEAVLLELARSKRITPMSILTYLQKEYKGVYNFDSQTAQKISTLFTALSAMKTDMFEAKPRRAVALSEIKQVLIPSRSPNQELLQALDEKKIPYTLYKRDFNTHTDERAKIIREMDGIRFALSETDSNGKALTQQQRSFFEGTMAVDSQGRLLTVYHGSPYLFTEFNSDRISEHGSSEGQGFYFTDSKDMAAGYSKKGGQLLEGYLRIKKPLSDSEITITRKQVEKLLRSVDTTGDDVIINYAPDADGYGTAQHKQWYERGLRATVDALFNYSSSDSEILADIANSGAGTAAVLDAAYNALGYDGYIVADKYSGATVYVVFDSSQFKKVENIKPTASKDIRYALTDAEYSAAVKNGDADALQAIIEQKAREQGYNIRAYHGSNSVFTVFDRGEGGQSNEIASVGFWFTTSRNGAYNFAESVWYGNNSTPTVYDVFLKLKNPKIYESTMQNDAKIKRINEQIANNHEQQKPILTKYTLANSGYMGAIWFERLTKNPNITYAKSGVANTPLSLSEARFEEIRQDAKKIIELNKKLSKLQDRKAELIYSDAYEKFKTDIYKYAGMNAEDANFGGLGKAIYRDGKFIDKSVFIEQYKRDLIKAGYDGIIIKDTRYDAETMGGKNTQYVVFDSQQIKSADAVLYDESGKLIPLSKRFDSTQADIRYALSETDSQGRTLTDEQRAFFKDSKVVDENGHLLVVYHGTNAQFNVFNKGNKNGWLGKGIYFAQDKGYARENGKYLVSAYLNAKNPFIVTGNSPNDVLTELQAKFPQVNDFNIADVLQENGYDAIIFTHWDNGKIISVLDSNQIKLTSNKNPSLSSDIRYALSDADSNPDIDPTESDNSGAIGGLSRGQ
ncbi:MAG: hypothetical protein NC489_23120, partial [Ruminococcus flavefaciens]|nr:hypothetical protein [Ruminococcus flavefaciens]